MNTSRLAWLAGALWAAICLAILYAALRPADFMFTNEVQTVPGIATVNVVFGLLSLLAGWAVGQYARLSGSGRAAAWSLLCLTLATVTTLAVGFLLFEAGIARTRKVWQGWVYLLQFSIAIVPQPFLLLVGSLLAWIGPEPRRNVDKGAIPE